MRILFKLSVKYEGKDVDVQDLKKFTFYAPFFTNYWTHFIRKETKNEKAMGCRKLED